MSLRGLARGEDISNGSNDNDGNSFDVGRRHAGHAVNEGWAANAKHSSTASPKSWQQTTYYGRESIPKTHAKKSYFKSAIGRFL